VGSTYQRENGEGKRKQAVRAVWAEEGETEPRGGKKEGRSWAGLRGRKEERRKARLGWAARRKRERKKKRGMGRAQLEKREKKNCIQMQLNLNLNLIGR
jgi:hypothetical protein